MRVLSLFSLAAASAAMDAKLEFTHADGSVCTIERAGSSQLLSTSCDLSYKGTGLGAAITTGAAGVAANKATGAANAAASAANAVSIAANSAGIATNAAGVTACQKKNTLLAAQLTSTNSALAILTARFDALEKKHAADLVSLNAAHAADVAALAALQAASAAADTAFEAKLKALAKVDGKWSNWSSWGGCSKTCGTGSQSRTRTCQGRANGGAPCAGSATGSQNCNTHPCPVNGNWSGWGGWGGCSKACGTGSQSRTRTCQGRAHGGAACSGSSSQSQSCNTHACPPPKCSTNGLQAHYTFDGHWSASSKGSHNWATSRQGSSYGVAGKHATALNFDGNDRIAVHAGGAVSENNFGISLWFKTSNANAGGLFCVDHHGHDRHFGIASNRMYIRTWPHGSQHPGHSGIANNHWRHTVYTVGPSGEKIFVDGNLIHHRGHVRSSSYSWDQNAYIGWSTDRGYFHGKIDDVRIFNHELSQSEVSEIAGGCF